MNDMAETVVSGIAAALDDVFAVPPFTKPERLWHCKLAGIFMRVLEARGYRIVPVAETETMYNAGLDVVAGGSYGPDEIYAAMLTAAPKVIE